MSSTTVNALTAYAHMRYQCQVHPFSLELAVALKVCPKCYCYVCDVPSSECGKWEKHCKAKPGVPVWEQVRKETRRANKIARGEVPSDEDELIEDDEGYDVDLQSSGEDGIYEGYSDPDILGVSGDGFVGFGGEKTPSRKPQKPQPIAPNSAETPILLDHDQEAKDRSSEPIADVKVNPYQPPPIQNQPQRSFNGEVLSISETMKKKFTHIRDLEAAQAKPETDKPLDVTGDVPQLKVNDFWMKGLKVGWPFPKLPKPQRQICMHILSALQTSTHCIIESPTGTGKSAAILCSVLAWQRHHKKLHPEEDTVRIIYCSRTHSQVQQMVKSLRQTPYRPHMAILGSRDRLCIHEDLAGAKGNIKNVNLACRNRVKNTEKFRKKELRAPRGGIQEQMFGKYDDENPPTFLPSDNTVTANGPSSNQDDNNNQQQQRQQQQDNQQQDQQDKASSCTCQHYRCLTASRVAMTASQQFRPTKNVRTSCSMGGGETRLGTHDIEDLVKFGKNVDNKNDIALYRKPGEKSFALSLQEVEEIEEDGEQRKLVKVGTIAPDGPASRSALSEGDTVLQVNGSGPPIHSIEQVTGQIQRLSVDQPLIVDVERVDPNDGHRPTTTACPYFLSQELSRHAEIVFAPYNYILDPNIRGAKQIDLENTVVILDEAHNVEDTLRESGSVSVDQIEIAGLLGYLRLCAHAMPRGNITGRDFEKNNMPAKLPGIDIPRKGPKGEKINTLHLTKKAFMFEVVHELFIFFEQLNYYLEERKSNFTKDERSKLYGNDNHGVTRAEVEYKKFNTPDDKMFECQYFGPQDGRVPGCGEFFSEICGRKFKDEGEKKVYFAELWACALCFHEEFKNESDQAAQTKCDRIYELMEKLWRAVNLNQHYYVSAGVIANGTLDYAFYKQEAQGRFQKKARALAKVENFSYVRGAEESSCTCCDNSRVNVNILGHHYNNKARKVSMSVTGVTRQNTTHGKFCDGSSPQWVGKVDLHLLTPSILFEELNDKCRTVVFASGTLAPVTSFAAELGLKAHTKPTEEEKKDILTRKVEMKEVGRLQVQPPPLEAGHIIDLQKQLLAVSIGYAPNGRELKVDYKNLKDRDFWAALGESVATVIESIPRGGVLVFLPSFNALKNALRHWDLETNPRQATSDVGRRIMQSKGQLIVEKGGGSKEDFERMKEDYARGIQERGSCVLFAVYRGKMSEGVSFNDNFARGVICVGIPYPSYYSRSTMSKKNYNDEQRRAPFNNMVLLPGQEWYSQQAYRALAQALGRCIRHAADYGTVVLMDSRHCHLEGEVIEGDGTPRVHRNLPKWMRKDIRNLKRERASPNRGGRPSLERGQVPISNMSSFSRKMGADIRGGWPGLKSEYASFFREAKRKGEEVIMEQRRDFEQKRGYAPPSAVPASMSSTSSTSSATAPSHPARKLPTWMPQNAYVTPTTATITTTTTTSSSSSSSSFRQQQANKRRGSSGTFAIHGVNSSQVNHTFSVADRFKSTKKPKPNKLKSMFEKQQNGGKEEQEARRKREEIERQTEKAKAQAAVQAKQIAAGLDDDDDDDIESSCIVCFEGERDTALMPCGHKIVCSTCAPLQKTCPNCREVVTECVFP
ncbi:hypothetical protein TrVE_jg9717 [Triparma verrucosa]|uniref:DNA helicase n=1 Tax=Triparma verrucosa TaxID=1606542 RepID=A0A9W7F493_9STRA|nr:hypothetical protein TrVE_jg9717 [Triparma verrucosa]